MRGTTDIICILALVSVVSTVQKCNNNSDVQAFRLIRKLGTAQLRFVTNLEGDMGTCRTTRRRNLYPESQSAVFRIRILQADEEDYTEFIETAKVTECPSTLEICVKDEPCNCYLRQGVYSDYQNCLIDRDPSFKPGDPQGMYERARYA